MVKAPGTVVDLLVLTNSENNPLTEFARGHGIGVLDESRFSNEAAGLARHSGTWLIRVNSTGIIPPKNLKLFEGRSLNFHPGLLPQYAGLPPHQSAIPNR